MIWVVDMVWYCRTKHSNLLLLETALKNNFNILTTQMFVFTQAKFKVGQGECEELNRRETVSQFLKWPFSPNVSSRHTKFGTVILLKGVSKIQDFRAAHESDLSIKSFFWRPLVHSHTSSFQSLKNYCRHGIIMQSYSSPQPPPPPEVSLRVNCQELWRQTYPRRAQWPHNGSSAGASAAYTDLPRLTAGGGSHFSHFSLESEEQESVCCTAGADRLVETV